MKKIHITTEKCGTCNFWIGERNLEVNSQGNQIVKISKESGSCRKNDGHFFGATRDCDRRCMLYMKWENIK